MSKRQDFFAIVALILVWLTFYWRIFTPNLNDQASFQEGDYSGQFVTFGHYQYDRLSDGQIPLWNPYNNGGLPFMADTQAAPLYPPRLLTIGLTNLTGGEWGYATLSYEVAAHVLIYTLLVYVLLRRMTIGKKGTVFAGLTAAITAGYGGFLTSYPQLQVALLEAAIWLPLALLGVLEATRHQAVRWRWLAVAGGGLGLSWLAGHPQTSWFSTYLIVLYLLFRLSKERIRWQAWIIGTGIIGVITVGIAAVHLLPGFEYLDLTIRTGLSFAEKGGGFVFNDLSTFLYPRVFWSPLYFGVIGLGLVVIALRQADRDRYFWAGVIVVGLALSFGANSAAFHALYNVIPGMSFFRGQERAAFLIANSATILVGFGVITMVNVPDRVYRWGWAVYAALTALIAAIIYMLWFGNPENYNFVLDQAFLTAAMTGLALFCIWQLSTAFKPGVMAVLIALIAFELLTVNIENNVIDPIPASERAVMQPSPLVQAVQADNEPGFRVDGGIVQGYIGIPPGGNTGSLYGLRDIRGISPLFLDSAHAIIQRESPAPVAWEVFAVKYVFSEAQALAVDSTVIVEDTFAGAPVYLHQLDNPRPFAHLVYDYEVIDSDAFARALLADPNFNARETAILTDDPLTVGAPSENDTVTIIKAEPEDIFITTTNAEPALLTVSLVHYPGWQVKVNDETITPYRAYGATIAIPLPAGTNSITLSYQPMSVTLGLMLSLVTWVVLGILGGMSLIRRKKEVA